MHDMSERSLKDYFGSPADRTRNAAKRPRHVKNKEVVAKQTKATLENGMVEADTGCSVQNQKIVGAAAVKDSRSRHRKTGVKRLKPPTKQFRLSAAVAANILARHADVYRWIKDRSGVMYLECKYCHDVLDDKYKATIGKVQRHVESDAHINAVKRWQTEEEKKASLFVALQAVPNAPRTLSDDENIFRAATVSAFLSAGIPMHKLTALRPYLEHFCNAKLDDQSNLKKIFLPRLRKARLDEVVRAVRAGAQICIVHDGTNRFSEFYCIVVRWCTSDFNLEERLLSLQAFRGAQKGFEIAHMLDELLNIIGVSKGQIREDGSVEAGGLLAVQRDRASVNQKAANVMKLMWLSYLDLECVPHTFSKVGEKMPLSALITFRDDLIIALNSQSFKAHCLRYVSKTLRKPSATRWWSTWELYACLLSIPSPGAPSYFERLLTACREAVNPQGQIDIDGVFEDSVRVRRLNTFAQDVERVEDVLLELNVVVEVFRPFVQATYALEGAGCCVMEVGPWFQYLGEFWTTFEPALSFPKIRAAIESIAAARTSRRVHPDHATARQLLEQRVRDLINPVAQQLSFVFSRQDGEMRSDVSFYMFCATLNPYEHGKQHMQDFIQPDAFKAAILQHFEGRFLPAQVDSMVLELPQFALECVQFNTEHPPAAPDDDSDKSKTAIYRNKAIWSFWRRLDTSNLCPHLRRLAQLVLSIVPSSAAAERCFSLLKAYFESQQLVGDARGALEDYIEQMIAMSFEENNKKNAFHAPARP